MNDLDDQDDDMYMCVCADHVIKGLIQLAI